ncbi:hypothetical protein OPT61_g9915 [Boeremia exigua]|uniref:Uncharacterized protein n=1 Tax=Boeremia exigua TaxID=749465 RepID=A0ACC2HS19_9PLEO|nr:hypothetical protein OPT61_g9915 [Boeremia exigua]
MNTLIRSSIQCSTANSRVHWTLYQWTAWLELLWQCLPRGELHPNIEVWYCRQHKHQEQTNQDVVDITESATEGQGDAYSDAGSGQRRQDDDCEEDHERRRKQREPDIGLHHQDDRLRWIQIKHMYCTFGPGRASADLSGDVGGQKTLRTYWKNYFEKTDTLIWVVDATDRERVGDCRHELAGLLLEERLSGASLLVFKNKSDVPGAMGEDEVREVGAASVLGRVARPMRLTERRDSGSTPSGHTSGPF